MTGDNVLCKDWYLLGVKNISSHTHRTGSWYILRGCFPKFRQVLRYSFSLDPLDTSGIVVCPSLLPSSLVYFCFLSNGKSKSINDTLQCINLPFFRISKQTARVSNCAIHKTNIQMFAVRQASHTCQQMTEASRSPHPYLTMLVVVLLSRYRELGSSIFPNKLVFGNERGNGRFISVSKKIDICRCDTTEIFNVKVPG